MALMRSSRLGGVVGSLFLLLTACVEPTAGTATAPSAPSAAPSRAPSPGRPRAGAGLAGLELRGRVAQLIVVGVALTALPPADGSVAEGVVGVAPQGRSSTPADELAAETAR